MYYLFPKGLIISVDIADTAIQVGGARACQALLHFADPSYYLFPKGLIGIRHIQINFIFHHYFRYIHLKRAATSQNVISVVLMWSQ
jgi:hypothetical protein